MTPPPTLHTLVAEQYIHSSKIQVEVEIGVIELSRVSKNPLQAMEVLSASRGARLQHPKPSH